MKKMILLGWLALFLAPIVWAEEKVEAPVWNVGDKWVFTQGSVEVVKNDQNSYFVRFSDDTCIQENQGFKTIIFEKSTLNRIYTLAGDKRKKYTMGLTKILNFPLSTGKQWKYPYSGTVLFGVARSRWTYDYSETITVQGWEDVEVRAGKFKALRLEYMREITSSPGTWGKAAEEIKSQYWYSPDVKYFVKCQYDKAWVEEFKEIFNWELTSFQSKK